MGGEAEFDEYADDYESALAQGLSVSGENQDHFARGRLSFLDRCLREGALSPCRAMDFGCGTGGSVPLIQSLVGSETVVGVDTSPRSIARATKTYATEGVTFSVTAGYTPSGELDLIYTNGVFHHIPLAERPSVVDYLHRSLRPGGVLALWENNPWNLGARYVMSKIPFDKDAIMLSAAKARRMLQAHGFHVLRTDYQFIFPAALKLLRPLEELLRRMPAGAQYQVLCTRT